MSNQEKKKQYAKSRKKISKNNASNQEIKEQYANSSRKQYAKSRKKHPKTICQREKDTLSAGDVASCGVRPSHTPASKLDNLIQEQIHKRKTGKT